MPTVRVLVLMAVITAGVLGCSDRPVEIEEERQSHRHLAEAYCRDWCTFWYDCEPVLANSPVAECRNGCETDEAWDWTDECGDIKWAFRECRLSLSCDEARNDPEIPGADDPCGDYYDELVLRDCWNDRRHGR